MKPIIKNTFWRKLVRVEGKNGSSYALNFNAVDQEKLRGFVSGKNLIKCIKAIDGGDKEIKKLQNIININKKFFWDVSQPRSLREYWNHEFMEEPHWDKIVTEGYHVVMNDKKPHIILWNWKDNKRLSHAIYINYSLDSPSNNFDLLKLYADAMLLDHPPRVEYTSFYIKATSTAVGIDLYPSSLKNFADHHKVAEILFSVQYEVFPYIGGHLCNAIPLPGKNIGDVSDERIISSPHVQKALKDISSVWGNKKATIIYVSGAPGSGKDAYSKSIHYGKGRTGELKTVDMTNTDEKQMRVRLFGQIIEGALRRGDIAEVENGTLFLDEINKTSNDIRSMLLRPLESNEYYPLDAVAPEKIKDIVFVLASPQKYEDIKQKLNNKKGEGEKAPGPLDLWSRIHHPIHITHPFEKSNAPNEKLIIENFFTLFWIKSFSDIFKVETGEMHSILRKTVAHKKPFGKQVNCYKPRELAICNNWRRFVYEITHDKNGIVSKVKLTKVLDNTLKLFIVLIRPEIGNISVRDFRNTVDRIAHSVYEEYDGKYNIELDTKKLNEIIIKCWRDIHRK